MTNTADVASRPRMIGLVTGLLEEAQAFRPGLGEVDRTRPFYCRHGERFIVACAGIGKVNAALASTCLINHGCDLLVSLGVAGRLCDGPHGPHWIRDAIQHDYGARRADQFARYRAGNLPFGECALEPYQAVADPGLGLPAARILSGDSFIEDEGHAAQLQQSLDGELIDMETGAIAQVACMYGVPWAGIRSVSDRADTGSVAEFQTNLNRAAKEASAAADRFLRML